MRTIIYIGIMPEAPAQRIYENLHGKTYMKFNVTRGICPGGREVQVSTEYEAPFDEIAGMAMHCLAYPQP
jgi:hypothetical protein